MDILSKTIFLGETRWFREGGKPNTNNIPEFPEGGGKKLPDGTNPEEITARGEKVKIIGDTDIEKLATLAEDTGEPVSTEEAIDHSAKEQNTPQATLEDLADEENTEQIIDQEITLLAKRDDMLAALPTVKEMQDIAVFEEFVDTYKDVLKDMGVNTAELLDLTKQLDEIGTPRMQDISTNLGEIKTNAQQIINKLIKFGIPAASAALLVPIGPIGLVTGGLAGFLLSKNMTRYSDYKLGEDSRYYKMQGALKSSIERNKGTTVRIVTDMLTDLSKMKHKIDSLNDEDDVQLRRTLQDDYNSLLKDISKIIIEGHDTANEIISKIDDNISDRTARTYAARTSAGRRDIAAGRVGQKAIQDELNIDQTERKLRGALEEMGIQDASLRNTKSLSGKISDVNEYQVFEQKLYDIWTQNNNTSTSNIRQFDINNPETYQNAA